MSKLKMQDLINFPKGLSVTLTSERYLKYQECFVLFFESDGITEKLKNCAEYYISAMQKIDQHFIPLPTFRFVYEIDLLKLHCKYEYLYDLLIAEPLCSIDMFKEITLAVLQQFKDLHCLIKSDIDITVNLTTWPNLSSNFKGLAAFEGTLIGKSFIEKYTRSSVWRCEDKSCKGSDGTRGLSVSSCPECSGHVEEDIAGREVGEMVLGKLIPTEAFRASTGMFASRIVRLKDELSTQGEFHLGFTYKIIGLMADNILDAWAYQQVCDPIEALFQNSFGHNVSLPIGLASLYLKTQEYFQGSAWVFPAAVISQLSSDYLPVSSFLHLKYGLFLSLASLKLGVTPVSVVAVGSETLVAQKLFKTAGGLAERLVYASQSPLGSITKADNGLIWGEAGDLILATNGICNLGDWSKYSRVAGLSSAVSCVEIGQVSLENYTNLDLPLHSVPLLAAVWTYWGNISSKNKDQMQLRTLINVFGMPFLTDDSDSVEAVCYQMLSMAVERDVLLIPDISMEELQQYIRIVTSRQVEMTTSASDLVKSYFVSCRKDRGENLPLGAIKTISTLAKAHARLALRLHVLPEDAALVIFLYEEALSHLFGKTINSDYVKEKWDSSEPIHSFIHRQMVGFMHWLQKFTA